MNEDNFNILKGTLLSVFSEELMLRSEDEAKSFMATASLIEKLGVSTMWSPDRMSDLTDGAISSPICLQGWSQTLLNATSRLVLRLDLYGFTHNNLSEVIARVIHSHSRQVTQSDTLRSELCAYVAPHQDFIKAPVEFIAKNLWLCVFFLYLATGAHQELVTNIKP